MTPLIAVSKIGYRNIEARITGNGKILITEMDEHDEPEVTVVVSPQFIIELATKLQERQ